MAVTGGAFTQPEITARPPAPTSPQPGPTGPMTTGHEAPARLGTAAAQPATGPTTSSRIDTATAVGRSTSAAAPPRPPLVPEGADHHPLGGCRIVVPAWPGGVGRQATDSTRQHRRSPGG